MSDILTNEQDLENWKNLHCKATDTTGSGKLLECVTPSGIVVHRGFGCNGCPYF